ncbi:BRO family protein, partial [Klebsiella pneumoniae]
SGRLMRDTTWLIDEPNTYKVLLRGHAPQSEPFRKWVTEEVLRIDGRTGQYDIAKSTLIIDNMSSALN